LENSFDRKITPNSHFKTTVGYNTQDPKLSLLQTETFTFPLFAECPYLKPALKALVGDQNFSEQKQF